MRARKAYMYMYIPTSLSPAQSDVLPTYTCTCTLLYPVICCKALDAVLKIWSKSLSSISAASVLIHYQLLQYVYLYALQTRLMYLRCTCMCACISVQLYPGRGRRRVAEDSDTLSEEEEEYSSTDSSSDGDARLHPIGMVARPIFPFPA